MRSSSPELTKAVEICLSSKTENNWKKIEFSQSFSSCQNSPVFLFFAQINLKFQLFAFQTTQITLSIHYSVSKQN